MIRQKDILNSLPLLASVLGHRYRIQVKIGGASAYTDGQIIHLPQMAPENDAAVVEQVRSYIDHESAHIRHTNFEDIRQASLPPLTHTLFNAIEDWRVENCLSALYPGCRENLHRMIQTLFSSWTPPANEQDAATAIVDYVILTVRSWDVRQVAAAGNAAGCFLERCFPGIRKDMDAILERVQAHCPDTRSAIRYARDLVRCILQWMKQSQPRSSAKDRQQKVSPQGKGRAKNAGENRCHPPKGESQKQSQSDSYGMGEKKDTDISQGAMESIESLFVRKEEELPQNLGERLAMAIEELQQGISKGITVASARQKTLPKLDTFERQKALRESVALRVRLQALLQARRLQRTHVGRRGQLHAASLYRLSTGNPKVFRSCSVRKGINTAVHILLDTSGSMRGQAIELARQSCYAMAQALSLIPRINPAVTAFPATQTSDVIPILQHGNALSDNFQIGAAGDTPLGAALWWVLQTLILQKEERKLILILTDGYPSDADICKQALEQGDKLGIEIYGIGIMSRAIEDILPKKSEVIHRLPELPAAMFSLLQQALLREGLV